MSKKEKDTTLRVLSIDWDYFADTKDGERLMLYPDSGNENIASGEICDIIWSTHYVSHMLNVGKNKECKKLEDIDVNHDEVALIKSIVSSDNFLVYAGESHKVIYDAIKGVIEGIKVNPMVQRDIDKIELVNIDFHHDVYDNGTELNCGNWLNFLIRDWEGTDSKFNWIGRADSDPVPEEFKDSLEFVEGIESYDGDLTEKWDLIYICKSGLWSPPHLDKYLIDIMKNSRFYTYNNYEEFIRNRMDNVRKLIEVRKDEFRAMGVLK